MENASKALLMAAGVLIGILILSLAVFLFTNFGSASAEINKQNEIKRINEFNVQFTVYEGKECTIHDIVSVANLAMNNNSNYSLTAQADNNYYISVNIKSGQADLQEILKENDKVNELIIDETNKKYRCNVEISENTKRVKAVNFIEIKQ